MLILLIQKFQIFANCVNGFIENVFWSQTLAIMFTYY